MYVNIFIGILRGFWDFYRLLVFFFEDFILYDIKYIKMYLNFIFNIVYLVSEIFCEEFYKGF